MDGYPGVTLWCFRVTWHRHMPSNSSVLSQFWAKFCCPIFLDMNIQHNNVPAIFLSKTSFEDWGLKWARAVLNILVVFTCTWQDLQSWMEEMAVTSHFNPLQNHIPNRWWWMMMILHRFGVWWGGMGEVEVWRYIPEQKRDVCTMYVFLPQTLKLMSFDILQYKTHFRLWNKPREH